MTPIAQSLARLSREMQVASPDYAACRECNGSGCADCDNHGAFPVSAIQAGRNKRPANPYSRSAIDRRNGSRGF